MSKCRRKIDKDGDDCTSEGREFHVMAALQQLEMTGDRQLTVGSWYDADERSRRHEPTNLGMAGQAYAALGMYRFRANRSYTPSVVHVSRMLHVQTITTTKYTAYNIN